MATRRRATPDPEGSVSVTVKPVGLTVGIGLDETQTKAALQAAKLRLTSARARAAEADADTAESLAATSKLALTRETQRFDWINAADSERRVYHFCGEVDDDSVTLAMDVLSRWHRRDLADGTASRPIVFRISSEGGEILAGQSLYTFLKTLTSHRPVITIASGLCASMATVIHQAGTERWIENGCAYLIHDAAASADGKVGDMEDLVGFVRKLNEANAAILAERSNLSYEEVAEKQKRKEWWLLGPEVVELGFADRFGSVFDIETAVGGAS